MKKIIVTVILGAIIINGSGVLACTGFTKSFGNNVFVGNNEDLSLLAEPQLRIIPPSDNGYGRAVLYCKWPYPFQSGRHCFFGGMNDQGLFFDSYSTPYLEQPNSENKPEYTGDVFELCIRTCATVDEVLDVFNTYYVSYMAQTQCFFVDKSGNAIIIEGDEIIYKQGNHMVVTNFLQTHPELGNYPCWRYNAANSMLENMTDFSVNDFKNICEAVHVEEIFFSNFMLDTIYSNICDLTNDVMYLYLFHNFSQHIEIRFPDIFENGYQSYNLPSLFVNNNSHVPNKPNIISGKTSGRLGREYKYQSIGTDDDGDLLYYYFNWGDGTNSGWIDYLESGEICSTTHVWKEEGNYEIRVKTKDIYGLESEWSEPLVVSMPKNKIINLGFFELIKNYPFLFPLLRLFLNLKGVI